MKKFFVTLALIGALAMTTGCGCRQTKEEVVVDETEVVVDSVDVAPADTLVVTPAAE